jgi:hypothetical protein
MAASISLNIVLQPSIDGPAALRDARIVAPNRQTGFFSFSGTVYILHIAEQLAFHDDHR